MQPCDILNKYQINEEDSQPTMQTSDEASICSSAMTSSVISAPSALRIGKYSTMERKNASQYLTNRDTFVKKSLELNDENGNKKREKHKNVKVNDKPDIHRFQKLRKSDLHISPEEPADKLPSYMTLPNGASILNSGFINGRCSRLSILFKKEWREFVWVHVKPATILIFRSLSDYLKWTNTRILSNSEKRKLIKLVLDFDTMGVLRRNKNELPSGGNESSQNSRIMKYDMADVKPKRSKIDGSIIYKFVIERWTPSGTRLEASFSSTDVMEVKHIRKAMRKCMKKVSKPQSKRPDDSSTAMMSATISDMTDFSQVSATEYEIEKKEKLRFSMRKSKARRS